MLDKEDPIQQDHQYASMKVAVYKLKSKSPNKINIDSIDLSMSSNKASIGLNGNVDTKIWISEYNTTYKATIDAIKCAKEADTDESKALCRAYIASMVSRKGGTATINSLQTNFGHTQYNNSYEMNFKAKESSTNPTQYAFIDPYGEIYLTVISDYTVDASSLGSSTITTTLKSISSDKNGTYLSTPSGTTQTVQVGKTRIESPEFKPLNFFPFGF